MPKIYQKPESKHEQGRDPQGRRTTGEYDRPVRTGLSREVIIAIAVIVALLVIFLVYRLAQGAILPVIL
ncbi:hypothetical protein SAMN06269301_2652 [Geobacter sp. DSM 9736]|nr:hypothetical protein SAMN06269301_2652 [Geobacter sp. DSM 9736]